MAEKSTAPDGARQGDGWGISWLGLDQEWNLRKSIYPMWKEKGILSHIPQSSLFLAHVRSASFRHHKEVLAYNQPFLREPYSFVFNGFLKGVFFPFQVDGNVGSQKIWTLLYSLLRQSDPQKSLFKLKEMLGKNSQCIQALNVGLCDKKSMYAYCQYSENPDYYNLQFFDSSSLKILSSEAIEGYDFQPIPPNEVLTF
jgi:predicted glutamine amidotransferase